MQNQTIPPSHCQLIPQSSLAFCESYHCSGRAAWSIGKNEGPISLRLNLCNKCVEQLVASISQRDNNIDEIEKLKAQFEEEKKLLREQLLEELLEELAKTPPSTVDPDSPLDDPEVNEEEPPAVEEDDSPPPVPSKKGTLKRR